MDGKTESIDTTNEIVQRIDKALDEYEGKIGLGKYALPSEAEKYLSMDHKSLSRLTAEQCGEAGVLLAQYGFHLQRSYNMEVARINWVDEEIRRTISGSINQYRGSSFEERKMMAIRDNDYASKLDRIKTWAKARSERLSYISSRIEFLARTMLELQQTKRRQYNGGLA